ncbi:MAG: 3-oxoacyl-[acyl-carrier-protein] reductase [Firmicutes bacterium]|nr:3-oxoacyl-[acyl-carrier-protein] reductase [Bacillota bacterium]
MLLANRVAVVTGATGGLGRSIALALAREGARVILGYSRNAQAAEELAAAIAAQGGEARAVRADITRAEEAEALTEAALTAFGRLDILVNNAGIARDSLLLRMKESEWDEVLDTNLKGVFLVTRAAVRPMVKQRWGRVINIASVVGLTGNAGQVNYSAAKAGVIGFTKALARELASRNITVNAVAPGAIDAGMLHSLSEEQRQAFLSAIPAGRLGRPEEVAAAVVFLASEAAGYITGQTLAVDGGMTMH